MAPLMTIQSTGRCHGDEMYERSHERHFQSSGSETEQSLLFCERQREREKKGPRHEIHDRRGERHSSREGITVYIYKNIEGWEERIEERSWHSDENLFVMGCFGI